MHALARLNSYYWTYKHLFIPGLLCAMASSGFAIIVPMVVRQAIDSIPRFVSTYEVFRNSPVREALYADFFWSLVVFGLIIILLSILSGIFSFLMRQTVVVASRHIEYDLRNRLFDHLQHLSHDFYVSRSTGDIITRATSDIEQVRRYIGPAIMYTTRALVIIVTAITAMFIISPRLTWYALIPMPLLAVSVFLVARMVHSRSDALQAQYSDLTSRVQESLSGIRVMKAYAREEMEAEAFDVESDAYRDRSLDLALVEAAWRPVFLVLVGMATIIVVWMGGRLVIEGAITLGNIAEFIIYVALMTWPVASMGFVITMVQRAAASMERLSGILDAEPAITDPDIGGDGVIEGRIRFENVGFRYPAPRPDGEDAASDDESWALRGLSFEAPAGSTLAIVGRTGSGKTTLVELIPRLLDVSEGSIFVDGVDVREWSLDRLRESIGYVPQDVFLFSDTIANNIAFGRMDASEDAIRRAAAEADLLENVEDFERGFETFVGERGITLSGGQKQRTSIARALIRDPKILILDDALSAVDVHTERTILGHLRRHFGKRTIVIVSHRVSAVQDADQIIVLDEGRIIEHGDHRSLLEEGGFYASLYEKQLLEQELEAMA
ncbi:MAG: ABC transporter ATP-binding protein [Rhodothermales bacterium]|nr:ABC transporter ATP-binding protein [Rhodothermales bacterium]